MSWDIIIVGGGAAGCVLASRLATGTDQAILLLEAGTDFPDPADLPAEIRDGESRVAAEPGSPYNWGIHGTITNEQGGIFVAQGKVIGGGSSINGQAMQRGFPDDFDDWGVLGNDEWSYAKVLPYFRRSERDLDFTDDDLYHGADGPMPVRRRQERPWPAIQQAFYDACLAAGYPACPDKNGPDPAGVGVIPSNNVDGVRISAALAYLNPARARPNLTVRGDTLVRRVLIDHGRAVGVEAEHDGEVARYEAGQVVLCAGALRSPQLLMLSGVGPADDLRAHGIAPLADLPGVGKRLWNHLSVQGATYQVKDDVSLHSPPDAPRFYLHFTTDGSSADNDMMMWTTPVEDGRSDRVSGLDGTVPADRAARITVRVSMPESSGYVRLASDDPTVQPEFNYQYLSRPGDLIRARKGVHLAVRLLESDAFKAVSAGRVNPTDAMLCDEVALDRWLRQTVSSSRHLSGTCAMGPDHEPMAVVDQFCRVKGIDGLWVVDASVMPRIPRSGGAHATVIMIGERVVDWVAAG